MQRTDLLIRRQSSIIDSARVQQVRGMFDLDSNLDLGETWQIHVDLPDAWSIGLIVGPSGSGKSTVSKELFSNSFRPEYTWSDNRSLVDDFRKGLSIKDITGMLSSVGFASPPAWLRPYSVLSTGQQFRVHVARALLESDDRVCLIDEFTSVVDRTVAQIGSAAIARTIRDRKQKFVAVSCHYDIIDWLDPDWIMEMPSGTITRRLLRRRPEIKIQVQSVERSLWETFRKHHYLNHEINKAARCFAAFYTGRPVAFCAVLSFPHPSVPAWRSHRIVCLPDFQGVGIGSKLENFVASLYASTGKPFRLTTSHPSLIRARARSRDWRMVRAPSISQPFSRNKKSSIDLNNTLSSSRLTATFEYIGAANPVQAQQFGVLK